MRSFETAALLRSRDPGLHASMGRPVPARPGARTSNRHVQQIPVQGFQRVAPSSRASHTENQGLAYPKINCCPDNMLLCRRYG